MNHKSIRERLSRRTHVPPETEPPPSSSPEGPVARLVAQLGSKDGSVRRSARRALVACGKEGVQAVIPLLHSHDEHLRWEAAKTLGEIGSPEAARALVDALDDENRDVRWLAAEALIGLGPAALEPLLHELIVKADAIWVREGAAHVLHALADDEKLGVASGVLRALEDGAPLVAVPVAAHDALQALRAAHFGRH